MTKSTANQTFLYRGRNAHHVRKALELTEVEDVPMLQLLERPNPWQAKAAYLQTLISQLLLSGNAYEEFVAPGAKGAPPLELWTLRPDRTRVLPGTKQGELVGGYEYKAGASQPMTFAPASVIHRKTFHPTDDFYGMSPLQAAVRAWQTDNESADWNLSLIKNQARPSGALIAPTVVGEDAYTRLKEEILGSYTGSDAAGLPIFLEGGLDWKQFSFSPIELDWLEGKALSKREICAAFNWPPELAGDSDAKTYNSVPEARKAAWMEAILPILDGIRDEYNARLCPLYSDRLILDYDRDQIDALAEDAAKVWDRVQKSTFISLNEAREAVGYDAYDDPEADVPRELAARAQQAADAEAQREHETALTQSQGVEPEDKPEIEKAEKALRLHRAKAQSLTSSQRRSMAVLRAAMKRFFKGQGQRVANHVAAEIGKEL
jgi:HK97 family phage portal protein